MKLFPTDFHRKISRVTQIFHSHSSNIVFPSSVFGLRSSSFLLPTHQSSDIRHPTSDNHSSVSRLPALRRHRTKLPDIQTYLSPSSKLPTFSLPPSDNFSQPRQEMKGPQNSDINNLLSGLKTRTINIHEQSAPVAQPPQNSFRPSESNYGEDDSVISIASLKDMQGASVPKRVNRGRNRSDKNTISLDI